MRFQTATLSETGPRKTNEDVVGVWEIGPNCTAVAIADGLGGLTGGALASRIAIDSFQAAIRRDAMQDLRPIAQAIHSSIKQQQDINSNVRAMATTLSAAVFITGRIIGVHCGDTRIVVARNSGIKRLTTDHTEAQKLFAAGKLTRDELASYSRKNILESALGMQGEPQVDTIAFDLLPEDRIFFTTDGLHGKILLRELLQISQRSTTPAKLVDIVRGEMLARGADDNYSLVAVYVS